MTETAELAIHKPFNGHLIGASLYAGHLNSLGCPGVTG